MINKLMTEQEKVEIFRQVIALRDDGFESEATVLRRTIPIPAYLAKVYKDKVGADFLIQGGWNLAEAENEYGQDWLTR